MCAVCPRHRARFKGGLCINLNTGEVKNRANELLPFPPVATFKCRVENGDVFIGEPSSEPRSKPSKKRSSSKSIEKADSQSPSAAARTSESSNPVEKSLYKSCEDARHEHLERKKPPGANIDPHKRLTTLSQHTNAAAAAGVDSDFNLGVWKIGVVSYRKWLAPDLLEIRLNVDFQMPAPGTFYHFYIEFEGVEREYTPAPGTKDGLAVLFIRVYLNGEFSQLTEKLKLKKEVRMCIESTLPTKEVPVGLALAGTASLVAFQNLALPHICSVRKDKEFEVYEKFGLERIKITGPPPRKPEEPTDCCGEGCDVCVMDTYQDNLEKYEAMMERPRGRITAEDIASLPDGPIGISGPTAFIEQIMTYIEGTKKTPLVLDFV